MTNYDANGGAGVATLFSDIDCRGRSGVVWTYGEYDVKVPHDSGNLWRANTRNDSVTSVMVPIGYTLTLNEGEIWDNYDRSKTFQGAVDHWGFMACQNVDVGGVPFNDLTTSATITKNSSPYATGYWMRVGTGRSKYTFKYGF